MKIAVLVISLLLVAAPKVQAATLLFVHICQGTTCSDFGPSAGPGPFVNSNIVVGDFAISGSVSSLENGLLSNAATTTISVQRLSTANDAEGDDLSIWLSASNFNLPDITAGYTFRAIMGATSSAGPTDVPVEFQGWVSAGNVVGFPPAGLTPGSNDCTLAAGTDSCSAPVGVLLSSPGAVPFTMTTRTTFTITDASLVATYTSNAQANIVAAEVPEPASILMLGTGLAFVARRFTRKKE